MNLVDRANRQRWLTAMSLTLRSGRIAANASVPTTTYTYDANGNVTQAGGWTYVWDYLNRMLASGYNNSTTTYGYDTTGARVLQTSTTSTTSTTYYPSKFFSLASTTSGSTSWATSTNYIWLGDTLLGTIDQKLYNGTATGTSIARYVHPDHLGSTNVVTDASGNVAQLLDYYPYGATRVSSTTFPTNEKRQYIDQFSDTQTGLDYLNARYVDPQRGQFLSEDPVFLGNPLNQNLQNPQTLNVYAYANGNPITGKDPDGRQCVNCAGAEVAYTLTAQEAYDHAFGPSSNAVYGGDIVAASIYGGAYPWTLVAPAPIAAFSAGAGNVTQQGLEFLSGDRTSFDASQVGISASAAYGVQAGLGKLPIPLISASFADQTDQYKELPRPLLKYARQASLVEQPTLPGLGLQYCCSSCA